ncbi:DegT/DnrJ/EryC1/StrS family aminotransferase [Actinomycetospora sp. OC33-EN08]|uniref:DegT/DnrJ/EryC1/StrS family aminotransferase n=1 Tax=Actinomycetospora aurantiaca TaxID=3129233 RepID=A0ABU8MGJ4_9PSEU
MLTPTEDEIAAVVDCYRRGWLTQGPGVRDLESALGGLFSCHARVVATPTAALHLILRVLGVGSADEVTVVERRRGEDLPSRRERHRPVVEEVTGLLDGRPAALAGDLAYLSFAGPLGLGSGGAVLTASAEQADLVASLRSHAMTSGTWERHHGREETYDVVDLGYNYRFDEPRAVLALARLAALGARVETR